MFAVMSRLAALVLLVNASPLHPSIADRSSIIQKHLPFIHSEPNLKANADYNCTQDLKVCQQASPSIPYCEDWYNKCQICKPLGLGFHAFSACVYRSDDDDPSSVVRTRDVAHDEFASIHLDDHVDNYYDCDEDLMTCSGPSGPSLQCETWWRRCHVCKKQGMPYDLFQTCIQNATPSYLFDDPTLKSLAEPAKSTSVSTTYIIDPAKSSSVSTTYFIDPAKSTSVSTTYIIDPAKFTTVPKSRRDTVRENHDNNLLTRMPLIGCAQARDTCRELNLKRPTQYDCDKRFSACSECMAISTGPDFDFAGCISSKYTPPQGEATELDALKLDSASLIVRNNYEETCDNATTPYKIAECDDNLEMGIESPSDIAKEVNMMFCRGGIAICQELDYDDNRCDNDFAACKRCVDTESDQSDALDCMFISAFHYPRAPIPEDGFMTIKGHGYEVMSSSQPVSHVLG